MREAWRQVPLPEFSEDYQVSNLGQVRSLKYGKCRLLVPVPGKQGYLGVSLSKKNRVRRVPIHLLVLLAFKGPRPAGKLARHRDGINTHNVASNLRWGTVAQNNRDTVRHGHHCPPKGEAHYNAKLSSANIALIFKLRAKGWTQNRIADRLGVTQSNVSYILSRKTRRTG